MNFNPRPPLEIQCKWQKKEGLIDGNSIMATRVRLLAALGFSTLDRFPSEEFVRLATAGRSAEGQYEGDTESHGVCCFVFALLVKWKTTRSSSYFWHSEIHLDSIETTSILLSKFIRLNFNASFIKRAGLGPRLSHVDVKIFIIDPWPTPPAPSAAF